MSGILVKRLPEPRYLSLLFVGVLQKESMWIDKINFILPRYSKLKRRVYVPPMWFNFFLPHRRHINFYKYEYDFLELMYLIIALRKIVVP